MSTFHLKISTPDGLKYDGEVERLRVRVIDGDVSLLANHMDYVSAVGVGEAAACARPHRRQALSNLSLNETVKQKDYIEESSSV